MALFKCAVCLKTFEEMIGTEEKAIERMKRIFGQSFSVEDCDIVCENCYAQIDPKNHPHEVEEAVAEQLRRRGKIQ